MSGASLPILNFDFTKIKDDYIDPSKLLNDNKYLQTKTPHKDSKEETPSFFIFDARDYIDTIKSSIKSELSNYGSNEYGSRGVDGYSNEELYKEIDEKTLPGNIKNILESENSYLDNKAVFDFSGNSINKGVCNKILSSQGPLEKNNYWIKYPSKVDEREDCSLFSETFDDFYGIQNNIKAKAYLFLQSMPVKAPGMNCGIIGTCENGVIPRALLLREGSYYWYKGNSEKVEAGVYKKPDANNNETYIGDTFKNGYETIHPKKSGEYLKWKFPIGYTPSRIRVLTKYFEDWATNTVDGFAKYESYLRDKNLYTDKDIDKGLSLDILNREGNLNEKAEELQFFLRELFFSVDTVFDLYPANPISLEQSPIISCSRASMREAFKGFMIGLNNIYGGLIENSEGNINAMRVTVRDNAQENSFKSKDIKLSTYMTLKSLYDKWLCAPAYGPTTWTLRNGNKKSDFENFIYVDTYYHDIGDVFTINLTELSNWISDCLPTSNIQNNSNTAISTSKTVINFLTEIAQKSGAMLMTLPQRMGSYNIEDVKNMFKPISIYDNWDQDEFGYVFMYTYKPSEHLGDSSNSDTDMNGWTREGDGINLCDEDIVGAIFDDDGMTIPAFGVTYAKQNQSLFKNIKLSNANAGASEVAIAGTMNVASKASESPRESILYGQDIYKILSQYAFKCGAEILGNMQITPLMYFQLNNVPFWKGIYQIMRVTHNISAGNFTTSFEGVRVKRQSIPIANGVALTLRDTGESTSDNGSSYIREGDKIIKVNDDNIATGVEKNYPSNSNYQLVDKIDFIENNVSNTTPIISLTPAHGPNTDKSLEWTWSSKVVDKIVDILKDYKYKNGTHYNVQRCNKDGNHTGGGYSTKETQNLIKRFGSDKVIHIAPHWNCGGNSYYLIELDYSWKVRRDSTILANCMKSIIQNFIENNKEILPTTIPNNVIINSMDKVIGLEKVNEDKNDSAPRLDCACVLTENWFADWDYNNGVGDSSTWGLYGGTIKKYKKDKCKNLFCNRLLEDDMIELVAQMHAEGIKKYIDSLS